MTPIFAQAANLLRAAGFDVALLRPVHVERDCYDNTEDKMMQIVEQRASDNVMVTGGEEHHGRISLVREDVASPAV